MPTQFNVPFRPNPSNKAKSGRFPWYRFPLELQQAVLSEVFQETIIAPIFSDDPWGEAYTPINFIRKVIRNGEEHRERECQGYENGQLAVRFGHTAESLLEFEKGTPGILRAPLARASRWASETAMAKFTRKREPVPERDDFADDGDGEEEFKRKEWEWRVRNVGYIEAKEEFKRLKKWMPLVREMLRVFGCMVKRPMPKRARAFANLDRQEELMLFKNGSFGSRFMVRQCSGWDFERHISEDDGDADEEEMTYHAEERVTERVKRSKVSSR